MAVNHVWREMYAEKCTVKHISLQEGGDLKHERVLRALLLLPQLAQTLRVVHTTVEHTFFLCHCIGKAEMCCIFWGFIPCQLFKTLWQEQPLDSLVLFVSVFPMSPRNPRYKLGLCVHLCNTCSEGIVCQNGIQGVQYNYVTIWLENIV